MNDVIAERIKNELVGSELGEWTITEYVGHGKSAIVFRGRKGDQEAAVKVFDPDLVIEFGREVQLARIEREISLIGKEHPNLIRVLGGGAAMVKNTEYLYVVMDYLPHRNLHQVMNDVPRDAIFRIINQVAQAAKFLEENGLVHRDIKPDNIVISDDFEHATLLDLGVLRPVALSEVTDQGGKLRFVGTLQYSPPEFLTRNEENTTEAWRSITFYQLGAVLHDLIMRCRIFDEYRDPYARMVHAVGEVTPQVQAEDVDDKLVLLTKCCLIKDPAQRLGCVSWDDFLSPRIECESLGLVLERLRKKQCLVREATSKTLPEEPENQRYTRMRRLQELVEGLRLTVLKTRADHKDYFPPFQIRDLETPDKSEAVAMAVSFGSSPQNSLKSVQAVILMRVSLLDVPEEILELGFAGLVYLADRQVEGPEISEAQSLFRGPYDEGTVTTLVERILFGALEQSLDFQTRIDGALNSVEGEEEPFLVRLSLS